MFRQDQIGRQADRQAGKLDGQNYLSSFSNGFAGDVLLMGGRSVGRKFGRRPACAVNGHVRGLQLRCQGRLARRRRRRRGQTCGGRHEGVGHRHRQRAGGGHGEAAQGQLGWISGKHSGSGGGEALKGTQQGQAGAGRGWRAGWRQTWRQARRKAGGCGRQGVGHCHVERQQVFMELDAGNGKSCAMRQPTSSEKQNSGWVQLCCRRALSPHGQLQYGSL